MNLTDEIYARLKKGEDIDDIAGELASHVNEANRLYREENLRNEKPSDTALLLDTIHEYVKKYYADSILDPKKKIDAPTLIKFLDNLVAGARALEDLADDDEIIEAFLKTLF